MKHRMMAIPLAAFLLVLCIPPGGQTQTDDPAAPLLPRGAQAASAPQAPDAQPLSEEQLADLHMARKEYKEAGAAYKKLAQQNPSKAVYLNKLGIAYHQQIMLGAALKSYQQAFRVDSTYADAMNNVGTIWYQRKKYGKAIKAYRKALSIRPDMAVIYSNLGYAFFSDKKYEEAIATFRQALVLDPELFERAGARNASMMQDRSVTDRGRFYFLLAKSFAEAGNPERCMHYLRKAREEGFKGMEAVRKDPAFAAVLRLPGVEELLAPPTKDTPNL